jgi:hypothetical protein
MYYVYCWNIIINIGQLLKFQHLQPTNRDIHLFTVPYVTAIGITPRYRLDSPGVESRWSRDFSHPSRPALEPSQPPIQRVPGLSRR